MRPEIRISAILTDLQNGLTRTTTSANYDATIGSIEEKYELSKTQVSTLFKHPQLLKKRTIIKKDLGFTIIDDTTVNTPIQEAMMEGLGSTEESIIEGSEIEDEATTYANDTSSESSTIEEESPEVIESNNAFDFN